MNNITKNEYVDSANSYIKERMKTPFFAALFIYLIIYNVDLIYTVFARNDLDYNLLLAELNIIIEASNIDFRILFPLLYAVITTMVYPIVKIITTALNNLVEDKGIYNITKFFNKDSYVSFKKYDYLYNQYLKIFSVKDRQDMYIDTLQKNNLINEAEIKRLKDDLFITKVANNFNLQQRIQGGKQYNWIYDFEKSLFKSYSMKIIPNNDVDYYIIFRKSKVNGEINQSLESDNCKFIKINSDDKLVVFTNNFKVKQEKEVYPVITSKAKEINLTANYSKQMISFKNYGRSSFQTIDYHYLEALEIRVYSKSDTSINILNVNIESYA